MYLVMMNSKREQKSYKLTCFILIPDLSKKAKSPNSWGKSSLSTAMLTLMPVRMFVEKAAPIANPSIKL